MSKDWVFIQDNENEFKFYTNKKSAESDKNYFNPGADIRKITVTLTPYAK